MPIVIYSVVIRRKSTMLNFCIRISESMALPRRKRKQASTILGDGQFNLTTLMECAQLVLAAESTTTR